MDLQKTAEKINILGAFCGIREIDALDRESLLDRCRLPQADALILFGGCIPYGCDVVGEAAARHIAKNLILVGGEGHTTESLRRKIGKACPQIETAGRMEADILSDYLRWRYGIGGCLIERESTNCGNNVTNALKLMSRHGIRPKQLILVQDATMQRRMDAGFRKYLGSETRIINFASYQVKVVVKDGALSFEPENLWGMWSMRQYVTLLMGEIPRLSDDRDGYGPNGKDYIAHVEIPPEVAGAFADLRREYGDLVRAANPLYATAG
jgi:hypothetical protein